MSSLAQLPNEQDLIHLTDAEGSRTIQASGVLRGVHGIFAVPELVRHEPWYWKVLRTGLNPGRTTHHVDIPAESVSWFSRPLPLGPYSAWKYLGEVYIAPAGEIALASGQFKLAQPWVGPRLLIYSADGLFYLAVPMVVLYFFPAILFFFAHL